MLKLPLQRVVLGFVLMLGAVAVISSASSCRRIDVLDPKDHDRDTSHGRDTTIVHDTNNTDTTTHRDSTFVGDTNEMVINGEFSENPGTFLPIPSPWAEWGTLNVVRAIHPQWSQANGCGTGFGSMLFYASVSGSGNGMTGVWEEMRNPFLRNKSYNISLCAHSMPVDSSTSVGGQVTIATSQDGGVTLAILATFHLNSYSWSNFTAVATCPIDSKTVYIIAQPESGATSDAWISVDNLRITQR